MFYILCAKNVFDQNVSLLFFCQHSIEMSFSLFNGLPIDITLVERSVCKPADFVQKVAAVAQLLEDLILEDLTCVKAIKV